ncbi:flagellar filament capping protein FliD [Vibrio sp. RC27]
MSMGPIGMSSGMDINSLVSKIVDSERVPKQQRIDNTRMENNASISAYGHLRESLDTMKNLMAGFRQDEAFATRKVGSSDENVVNAVASTKAIAGRYAVDVLQLAQSHKVASHVLDEDVRFGPGKLQISLGKSNYTVDVQSGTKLQEVVAGINRSKGNPGVRASIINDKEGPRLIVASDKTGEDNKISIRAEAVRGNPLKQLEYKTLEERVKDIEAARSEAQQLIAPLSPDEQKIAKKVAEKMESAARLVDEDVAAQIKQAAGESGAKTPETTAAATKQDANSGAVTPNDEANVAAALQSQSSDVTDPNEYVRPEDRIPGWSETASGTLLDSYRELEPDLDPAAIEKLQEIPGASNSASGTLFDSYVTPEEAQSKLEAELKKEQRAIDQAVANGGMTEQEAKELERSKLSPEEKEYINKVELVQARLEKAQQSFEGYQGMKEVETAQNAEVLLDGVARLSSDNNIIEDAIDGVDLELAGLSPSEGKPAEINIEYDRETVRNYIEQFVDSYNQFYRTTKSLSSVDPQTGEAGPLAGDSVVRSADSRLKRVFSTQIESAPAEIRSLTEFGVTTTRQGTLEINSDMLTKQINNNFSKLGEFFGGRDGFAKRVEDSIQSLTGVTGSIRTRERTLTEQNYRLGDDQATLDRRMQELEKRTQAKFSAMQDATGKMQSQLSGMMNALG